MKGKYIYGIISSNGKVDLPVRGVYTIEYNNLSAIVKDAPIKTYEADQKGLLAHNRVLDEIIKIYTVVPFRYGTIAHSEKDVKGLLRSAKPVLLNILARIRDKVEFDMEAAITDEQPIIKEILERNEEIRGLRDRLVSKGGGLQVQDRILIGKMLSTEVNLYKANLIQEIGTTLKPYYSKVKSLGKGNLAFLVPRNRCTKFESTIYKFGEKYGDRIKIKYAGPLAPYSFVELRLILINFNTVDTARRQLGLGQEATIDDIKQAYRNFAKEYHPDVVSGKEEEFKKIDGAYKILCEYCRRYPRRCYIFKPGQIDEFSVLVEEE